MSLAESNRRAAGIERSTKARAGGGQQSPPARPEPPAPWGAPNEDPVASKADPTVEAFMQRYYTPSLMGPSAKPVSRHRARPKRTRKRRLLIAATTVLALAAGGGVGWAALDERDATPAAAAPTDCPEPSPQHEQTYLRELELAGVPLGRPGAREKAVEIGRKHVEHCHLGGMRDDIERDFRAGLPYLTDEQVTQARVVMEHLFLDVTGRKQ